MYTIGVHPAFKENGLNSFKISVGEWTKRTGAIGLMAKSGRYGGTYAHKDIAFEFGSWISPLFKLLLIKEFQRLKEIESDVHNLEWDVKRILSKANYHIHTDAVKKYIIPHSKYSEDKQWIEYANEADMLNMCLFGCTAKEWKENNPTSALHGDNIRSSASINELVVLSNLEAINSEYIKFGTHKQDRFKHLKDSAKTQLEAMNKNNFMKSLKKINDTTFLEAKNQEN